MRSLILVLSLLFATSVLAQSVTVQNHSFETANTLTGYPCGSTNYFVNTGPIPNWTATGSGSFGSWQPNACFYNSIPDGSTIVYTNGPTLTQDLSVTALPNTTYTLSVYVGHRLDCCTGVATIQLFAGTTSLCSLPVDSSTLTAGTFTKQTVTCSTNGTPPSGNLIISLANSGSQSDFDNVSLTYTQGHSASLTWQDNLNPSGTTYNVYRSNGSLWNPVLLANVSTLSYVDATIVTNQSYVYKVTAVQNGVESADGQFISVTLGLQ